MILKSKAWDKKEKRFRNIEVEIERNRDVIVGINIVILDDGRGQLSFYDDWSEKKRRQIQKIIEGNKEKKEKIKK